MNNTTTSPALISLAQMTASIQRIDAMDLSAKSAMMDRIFAAQPLLVLAPLALKKHCPMTDVDCALHIMLALYDAFTDNEKVTFRQITNDDLAQVRATQEARLKFVDGDPDAFRQSFDAFPEKPALAFVWGVLQDRGLLNESPTNEMVVTTCLMILEALRAARLQP